MAVYENATCHTRVHVRVCACACVRVINENMHPFHDVCYLINGTVLIYSSNHRNFHHVELFLLFLCACDVVMWSVRLSDLIWSVNRHLSEGVRGAL